MYVGFVALQGRWSFIKTMGNTYLLNAKIYFFVLTSEKFQPESLLIFCAKMHEFDGVFLPSVIALKFRELEISFTWLVILDLNDYNVLRYINYKETRRQTMPLMRNFEILLKPY